MNREKGYNTYKREKILEYLKVNRDKAVTIGDIQDNLTENNIEINISTIYRYLEKLEGQGLILKTVMGKREQACFQYIGERDECHNHLHMKCEKCGMILHLDCGFMQEIAQHVMKEHGFMINCHDSYLTGLCEECRKKKKENMDNIEDMEGYACEYEAGDMEKQIHNKEHHGHICGCHR